VTRQSIRERQQRGIAYVTDDRLHEGVAGSLSVAENLLLKRIGKPPHWTFGFTRRRRMTNEAARLVTAYEIRTASATSAAGTLSGGNIQKLLLARELDTDLVAQRPRVVVFHKPSHGLDQQTTIRVHEQIREYAAGGGAALVISSDLDELEALADRTAVMSAGRIVGWVDMRVGLRGDTPREQIARLMTADVATCA